MINRDGLITQVSAETGFTKKDIKVVLDSIFNAISKNIAKGEDVLITNFGKFEVVKRVARICQNPQTKERMVIPEMNIPHFKASTTLKELVK